MFDRLTELELRRSLTWLVALVLTMQPLAPVLAGPNEQATRLFERLTGTPPSPAVLTQMASDITSGNSMAAADLAINDPGHNFYDVTIRNFAQPMSNKPQSLFIPPCTSGPNTTGFGTCGTLNDYTATIIGMVRDNVPFNTVLSADLVYVGNGALLPNNEGGQLPAYAYNNDNHYQYLDNVNADLAAVLEPEAQSSLTGIPSSATAGVLTTWAGASAYFYKGTNRAMVRFSMMDYLCDDLDTIEDTTRPPDRIRQDPSRSPGGDSRTFLTQCIGCHSGMDALAGAFAYYDFDTNTADSTYNQMVYTPGQVQGKYAINTGNFPQGYVTTDDSWINHWRSGPNSLLGWSSSLPGSGNGAKSFGQELENSSQFATCQATKAFTAMCLRPPSNAADRSEVSQITSDFVSGNYNLKTAFAESAVYCMGQ